MARAMSTKEEPRWLSDEEQAAWRALLRMSAALNSTLNRDLSTQTGLSLADYGVLVLLDESPGGRRRPYEIGRDLGMEKSRLSHQLARLSERGLVAKRRCDTDQRGWLISITPAGRKALRAAAPLHVEGVRAAFVDRLTPDQLRQLVAISESVLEAACARIDDTACDDA